MIPCSSALCRRLCLSHTIRDGPFVCCDVRDDESLRQIWLITATRIPDGDELGSKPQPDPKLIRDPEELEKAAQTFNGRPLLLEHRFVTAGSLDPTLVVDTIAAMPSSNIRT